MRQSCDFEVDCSKVLYVSKISSETSNESAGTDSHLGFLMLIDADIHVDKHKQKKVQKLTLFAATEEERNAWLLLITKVRSSFRNHSKSVHLCLTQLL